MIDEYYTWIFFGYHSYELAHKSNKPIIAVCDECGKYRKLRMEKYSDLCISCSHIGKRNHFFGKHHTDESKQKMSEAQIGKHPTESTKQKISEANIGKHHTEETKQKMSDSAKDRKMPPMTDEHKQNISKGNTGKKKPPRTQEHREKLSKAQKKRFESEEERRKTSEAGMGNVVTDETKRKISATSRGILLEDWDGFACEQKYCPKFNDPIKETIREKYNYACFICDKTQEENLKLHKEKLCCHHTDLNKNQGCDDHEWQLVPLCKSCHGSAHTEPLKSRIEYLRADEEHTSVQTCEPFYTMSSNTVSWRNLKLLENVY